jgi:hypothetical protein
VVAEEEVEEGATPFIVDGKIHRVCNSNFVGLFMGIRLQGPIEMLIRTCSMEIASPVGLR